MAIAGLILAVSLAVMLLSGAKLREARQIYRAGDRSYRSLSDRVRPAGPPVFDRQQAGSGPYGDDGADGADVADVAAGNGPGTSANVAIPGMTIDFEALQSINPDAVAWLYCPDTVIDYPVVRATEYDYYLHHLPDGALNSNGTLFTDYNWTGFSDRLMIVYGHNMRSGRMFGSLSNYKGQQYYDAHPYLYLYTAEDGNFRIDLLYGCVIGAGQWRDRAFMFDVNLESLLSYAAYNTTFASGARYEPGDRVVALSTCSYEFDDARYVVLGVLRPEFS